MKGTAMTPEDAFVKTRFRNMRWEGGGDGVIWTDTLNWNPDGTTATSDILTVGPGAAVVNGQNSFASLEIQTNASVTLASDLGGGRTLSVAGTLNRAGGVLRLNGAFVNLSGHLASTLTFLDTNGGSMSFTDGAAFDNANLNFEHKGNNTFSYTLSPSGFTTLVSGRLWSGSAAAWSNAAYNIDISAYTGHRPVEIVLADYNGHDAIFSGTFNPAVTITGYDGGTLRFDTAASKLILKINGPQGTIILVH